MFNIFLFVLEHTSVCVCVCVITAIQWLYQIQFKKKEGQMYF